MCVTGAWGTEETISLASHTLTDGVVVLNSTSGNATLTSNMATNIKNSDYDPRGVRWQYTGKYIQVVVAEGHKINSITLTSSSNGNNVTSLTYTLTDGSSALSGSWDNAPNSGKQASYTWTASSGTYYRTWYLNKTNDTGDIYISAVTINYEEASVSNTPPSIVTQPASTLDAYVGFEATLSVAASGYPAPTYQWYSCTNTEKANSAAIDGATNSSYTFTPSATGTYYYYCVAKNNYGNEDHTATSNVSTVTVGRKYSVEYSKGETGATISNTLPLIYYSDGTSITLPKNHYFYLAGSSVTKWTDGTNDHAFSSSHTVSSNVTFYPVFAANSKALGDEATTITWTFSRDAGAPVYAIEGNGKTCSVIGTTANGIDLKMDVVLTQNAEGTEYGKFNNTAYTNRAQVNKYTSFTIPAVPGMEVTYVGTSSTASTDDEILFGEDKAASVNGSTYSYTYNGSETTLTITDNKSGLYPSGITVSYPKVVLPPSFSPASGSGVTIGEDITISNNAGDATIYYQWDGNPADAAAVVSGGTTGTSVSTSALSAGSHTLYAVARKDSENSVIASATYTLENLPIVTLPTETRTGYSCTGGTTTVNRNAAPLNGKTVYALAAGISMTLTIPATTTVSKIVVYGNSSHNQNSSTVTIAGANNETSNATFNSRDGEITYINFVPATQTTTYTISSADRDSWILISIYGTENPVSLNAKGYSTFSCASNVQVTGADAYTATLDLTENKITCTKIADGKIPAGSGVLLYGDGGATVTVAAINENLSPLDDNDLKATTLAGGSLATMGNNTYYVLSGDTFKQYNGNAFVPGKAYFDPSNTSARSFTMLFENETTGINTVQGTKGSKADGCYNLAGQRVSNPTKGLYIMNGKKYIVK